MKSNKLEKLRRAIGLDYEHSYGKMQQEMPETVSPEFERIAQLPKAEEVDLSTVRAKKEDLKSAAPLFVKIDKHEEIAMDLTDAKNEIMGLVETIMLLAKAERLKDLAIQKIEKDLITIENKLAIINQQLVNPEEEYMHTMSIPQKREVSGLQHELNQLRSELSTLR